MTTIACDGVILAADGLITGNGLIHDRTCCKLHRLADGRVVGFTGDVFAMLEAVAFLNGERDTLALGENFEAIILDVRGRAYCMDGNGRTYRQSVPCATGSGGGIALGAMASGKDAFDAVKIAAEIDVHSGGVCRFMKPGVAPR